MSISLRLDELAIIDRYLRPLAGQGSFGLRDDAGLLAVPLDKELVVTTDMLARDVHFLSDDPPDTVAQKALRVNLSDLAAKGAAPLAYVLSLALSPDIDEHWLSAFADGLQKDQRRFGIRLLGGDTIAVPDRPVINVTAFGLAARGRMVHRFGGSPGDALFVSGMIGAGGAGLALLKGEAGAWSAIEAWERDTLVERFRRPEPRTALAPVLAEFASAAMDISDGLIGDCDKLAAACGCSAAIEAQNVPLPPGLAGSRDAGLIARLLTAGDDFEILAAVPARNVAAFRAASAATGVPVTGVGALIDGSAVTKVLFEGELLGLSRRAYVHGRVAERR